MRSASLELAEGRSRSGTDMWKILTRKFKAHSLEDIPPLQLQEADDHDSGTESDDENAELEAIEEAIQCNWDGDHYDPVLSPVGFRTLSTSVRSHCNGIISPAPVLNHPQRSNFKRAIQTYPDLHVENFTWHHSLDCDSPTSCYERCEYDVSDLTDDQSSEEELSVINSRPGQNPTSSFGDDLAPSVDGTVADLRSASYEPKPLKFISSPPKGVHKLRNILSPALFLARLSSNKVGLYSFKHRKRLKQAENRDVSDALRIERPCLDFDKMRVEFCL